MSKKLSTHFEDNRLSILSTAAGLFCHQGVHATSISDIAKTVKLSKGTVSYYYPSKDHLIYEVTEFHLSEVTDQLFAWIDGVSPGMPLESALERFFSLVFNTAEKCRLHICLLSDAILGNEVVRKLLGVSVAKWRTMAEAGLLKIGCTDYQSAADALFVSLDSVILRRAMGAGEVREKDICVHIAATYNK
jgi:TetR/AcrR family acrAB operon transcriptional repressor